MYGMSSEVPLVTLHAGRTLQLGPAEDADFVVLQKDIVVELSVKEGQPGHVAYVYVEEGKVGLPTIFYAPAPPCIDQE